MIDLHPGDTEMVCPDWVVDTDPNLEQAQEAHLVAVDAAREAREARDAQLRRDPHWRALMRALHR